MKSHRHTILVVDDDADARQALKELLELHEYVVATASDGKDALTQLRAGLSPCIILLDLRMGGMDGWEFRAEQMRDPDLRHFHVCVFSGDAEEETSAAALGIRLFLRKPVDFTRLFPILERHCPTAGSDGETRYPARGDQ